MKKVNLQVAYDKWYYTIVGVGGDPQEWMDGYEKLMAEEGLRTTPNKLIHIGMPIAFDNNEFMSQISELLNVACSENDEEIIRLTQKIVTTYNPKRND